jgi:hypothetical protein
MKGLGETKKPCTIYGWDEFVSPLNFYISNKIFHGSYGGAHLRLKPLFPVKVKGHLLPRRLQGDAGLLD